MASMELARIHVTSHEAARHDLRRRRVAAVKFVALPMLPVPCDDQQAFAQGTGARATPIATTLLSRLSRVIGRLVAARP